MKSTPSRLDSNTEEEEAPLDAAAAYSEQQRRIGDNTNIKVQHMLVFYFIERE